MNTYHNQKLFTTIVKWECVSAHTSLQYEKNIFMCTTSTVGCCIMICPTLTKSGVLHKFNECTEVQNTQCV